MQKLPVTSIRYLKGIGPKRAEAFKKAGIQSLEDMLYYFPRRYEDRTTSVSVSKVQEGQVQTVRAEILAKGARRSFRRRGFSIVEIAVGDVTGKIFCVWFNQPYLNEYFKVGMSVVLYGKVERYAGRLQMSSPEFEIISTDPGEKNASQSLSTGRIVPVYSLPDGIGQRIFRQAIKQALDEYLPKISDFLPYDIRIRNNLLNLNKSLINIHFPENPAMQKDAHRRLSFDEFFLFQVPLALRKVKKKEKHGMTHTVEGGLIDAFKENLPFRLTDSQNKVVAEIKQDMASIYPMQRLLQGDVGSGKTAVAVIAGIMALQGGYQVAFMVPTEILATQHYEKIGKQISCIKNTKKEIRLGLLTSSLKPQEKKELCCKIQKGQMDIVIGTHALLEEAVRFQSLGLVIIDEQHKFGVGQRALLPQKGKNPDVLIMTATPIPRTLAITLYGDLDVSVITELPPGRIPVKTLHFQEAQKIQAYALAKEQLRLGYQAYIMYPAIEESYALDIQGAQKMYRILKEGEFGRYRLGLIHGRLPQKKQDEAMHKFAQKQLDILVATTVLEVGIDMPQATCMIVEDAQRFGLSQLHQLRGRVGRGPYQSYCVLVSRNETEEAKARLAAMVTYNDGFHIAEEDLRIRGPGEFFGARQHGLGELKIANPLSQMQLLKRCRQEALKLVAGDPGLSQRQNMPLKHRLLQVFPEHEKLMVVG